MMADEEINKLNIRNESPTQDSANLEMSASKGRKC